MHNTVMVDGAEQNRFGEGGLFWLHPDATPRCLVWESTAEVDCFVGEHDGYARLSPPVMHRREFRLDKRARRIDVCDWLDGGGRHTLAWNFTLAPGVTVRQAGEWEWEIESGSVRALLRLDGDGSGGNPADGRGWRSSTHGSRRATVSRSRCARSACIFDADLPVDCRFRIEVL